MKLTWEYLAAAAAFVVTLLLAWFIGVWVKLAGANLLILRVGIIVLGVLCILGFLMWARGQGPAGVGTPSDAIAGGMPSPPSMHSAPSMPVAPSAPSASAAVAAIASGISPD